MITSLKVSARKKVAFVLILISLTALCAVIFKSTFMTRVLSVKAVTEIATSAFINVEPNPVGVGQVVRINMWVEPAPPTPTDVFNGITATVTHPNGNIDVIGPFMSNSNGSAYFEYVVTQVGTYTLQLSYSGQYFANSTIRYMPSMSPVITLSVTQEPVYMYQQIRINADGSINPPTTPISTIDNVTYTLMDDIYFNFSAYLTGGLRVERNNIVINGAGHTLQGLNSGYGIELTSPNFSNQHNVTIANITITQFSRGIYVVGSSNTIIGNNITNNNYDIFNYGIYLDSSSSSNSISENTLANNGHGVYVAFGSSNNSISANRIVNNQWGVHVYSSNNSVSQNAISSSYLDGLTVAESNNSVFANNITNSGSYGLLAWTSTSIFRNNRMNNNKYNFAGGGFNDVDVSNTVNGKPIYYWVNKQNMTVPADAGYVALINCTDITVQGLTLANNGQGILLESTTNIRINGNTLTNNADGLHVSSGNHSDISANNVTNNGLGFYIELGNYNNISANNIANNLQGIYADLSNHNSISANNITNNQNYGLNIFTSSYNDIFANNITNSYYGLTFGSISYNNISVNNIANNNYGIYVSSASNNTLYHNNFINNTNQVYFYLPNPSDFNSWDNGYPSGGNYWSDYNGTDANGDGIGDAPYVVFENYTDRYPLIKPFMTETPPAQSPSPTPTSAPAPTPTPSPTPSPSPNPSPNPSPSPSASPSPSPSPSPSEQPTQSPQPPSGTPQPELVYAAAAGTVAITIVTVTAVALKKKHHKNTS